MMQMSRQGLAPALIVALILIGTGWCSGLAQAQIVGPPPGVNGAQPAPRNTAGPVTAARSNGAATTPERPPPSASEPTTSGTAPARAGPVSPPPPTPSITDVEDPSSPGTTSVASTDVPTATPTAPAANNGPYIALGAVTAVILAAMGAMFLLFTSRFGALQREIEAVRHDEPEPLVSDHSFQFDPRALPPPRPWTERLAGVRRDTIPAVAPPEQVLAAASDGQVDMSEALSGLAHDVSALINHAFNTDETMNLLRRAIERSASRPDGAPRGMPEGLARLIHEEVEAAIAQRLGRPEATPIMRAPEPAPPPTLAPELGPTLPLQPVPSFGDLWTCADRLFRRVGLTNVTEEAFQQALVDKKAEILADGSYAQRPDLLRASPEAQNMAGVLRLASTAWANRSDEVTIPVAYRAFFADFVNDYADPASAFELIWAESGESAKDSAHETSRKDGVRHEVVSGVRWPGLRGGGEVYMRAKVAIAGGDGAPDCAKQGARTEMACPDWLTF